MQDGTPQKRKPRATGNATGTHPSVDGSGTGVTPVDGVISFTATRRDLPHWEEPGGVYFVTWSTIRKRRLTPHERALALDAIRHWDGIRWTLYAAVVMADHAHVLVQPLRIPEKQPPAWYALGSIFHSIKSYSAHEINRLRGQSGAVWQDEREDRIVRDEREFWEKWQYIRDNPVKEALVASPEEYAWFYQQGND